MEHGNAQLLSLATKDASNDAACSQDLIKDPGRLGGNRDEWMAHRRSLCLPLAKRVASVLKAMSDGAFVVRRGVILAHAPGTLNPVTWVDCLAVAPFGVFVIDQYDWMGTVKRSMNDDELLVRKDSGVVSVRTSPLRRAKPALRYLRPIVGEYNCPVGCLAVFADLYCALDPTLPESILQGSELHHFMRTRLNRFRDSHSRYLDSKIIATHLQWRCADWGNG
ncbi:nuclease-related domain-containing protein [Paraburkholderia xenovorans]|uniref:nuclease-related domain-containing protein n=1 Tax=Paraburkholderia xenovorans TaxID=36873 RepID=UPI0038B6BC53